MTNTYQYNWFLGRDGSYPFDFGPDTYTHSPSGTPLTTPLGMGDVLHPANTVAFTVMSGKGLRHWVLLARRQGDATIG